jgi:hypothetical protein
VALRAYFIRWRTVWSIGHPDFITTAYRAAKSTFGSLNDFRHIVWCKPY